MRVDLHLHTTASDGVLTPAALVHLARQRRLDVIAVTDHDTTAAIREARQAANGSPVVVSGIELSAKADGEDVHMLGYGIDTESGGLQDRLNAMRESRWERAKGMVDWLAQLGMPLDWQAITAQVNDGVIARPHIARALVERGYVDSIAEAFNLYLGNGRPAYVPLEFLTPEDAIQMIHEAGGAAVLAHPGLLRDYGAIIARLVPVGLDGLEVIHPRNPQHVRLMLRSLAKQYDLIITGGSDFHDPREGGLMGAETVPHDCIPALYERMRRYSRTNPG